LTVSIDAPESAPNVQAYSPGKAAVILGCSRDLVDKMLAEGALESTRFGGRIFIPAQSIANFLRGGGQ